MPSGPDEGLPICISSTSVPAKCSWRIKNAPSMSFTGNPFRLVFRRGCFCLGLIRGSETASLGWWHPVFVSQVMQQHHSKFPRCSCLLWTRSTGAEGLANLCNVHEQLLPCLVLRPREE